jgi:hypothetical protein
MSELVAIERECASCHKVRVFIVTGTGFAAWDMGNGEMIDKAFPELNPADRDWIRLGICGECFDAMLPPEPDRETDSGPVLLGSLDPADAGAFVTVHLHPDGTMGPTPAGEDANPGPTGVTPSDVANAVADALRRAVRSDGQPTATPAQCVERAALGLTAEGEPATRGHIHVSDPHWPRCSTELPGVESIVWQVQPNICNRPATLLMAFTAEYVKSMTEHRCGDPDCPIAEMGGDADIVAELQRQHIPVCGMHLTHMRHSERQFIRDIGGKLGITRIFTLAVIGVESTSLLNGHPEASIIDLRPITGVHR